MKLTTLCYIEQDGCYLMMHRIRKANDPNHDKWIGVGGKFEDGESPEECLLREVREETGLTLTRYQFRGIVTFVSDQWETEYMHLFTADAYEGELRSDEREGVLEWIPISLVPELPLWEGDRLFLKKLLEETAFFSMKLVYRGEELVEARISESAKRRLHAQENA